MATLITAGRDRQPIKGDPEKRVDTAPDGTLWAWVSAGDDAHAFFSRNGGARWRHAGESSKFDTNYTHSRPSFFIDRDGYAHVSSVRSAADPQLVDYARGRPRSGGGWVWDKCTFTVNSGRFLNACTDIVVVPRATGWTVFLVVNVHSRDPGPRVVRLEVSAGGRITLADRSFAPAPVDVGPHPSSVLEFAHTGNGKTPSATPHLLLQTGNRSSSPAPLRAWRAVFAGGSWAWEAPVTLDTGVAFTEDQHCAVWDGDRLCSVWAPTGVRAVRFAEWPGTQAAPVRRDPPALPVAFTAAPTSVNIAHDPTTDDIYVVAGDGAGSGDVWSCRLTRSSATWGAWALEADREASGEQAEAQLVRHAQQSTIDLVWSRGAAGGWKVYHQVLGNAGQLVRKPPPPVLLEPANGARLDLAAGATFSWDYSPTGASDTQQAWLLQRQQGTAAVQFWNAAAQAWSATAVWNPGAAESASFPPGAWASLPYTWTVRTRSSSGQDSNPADGRLVVGTAAPQVTALAPTGLLFGVSTPTVEWEYLSEHPQRSFQVRVFLDLTTVDPETTTPLWDSGVVTSAVARQTQVGVPLQDQESFRAYVRATSFLGQTSAWSVTQFVLSLAPPSGPLVEGTSYFTFPDEVPRARLRLTARSNLLGAQQALGQDGWEALQNVVVSVQEQDSLEGLEQGLRLTGVTGSEQMRAQSAPGSPPVAPVGQEQPLGPLDFAVQAGETYTVVAHFRSAAGLVRPARVDLRWLVADDGTSEEEAGYTQGDQINTSDVEYRPAVLTVTAPARATRARVVLAVAGIGATPETHFVSRISLHPGSDRRWQPGGYADTQTLRVERSTDGGASWTQVADVAGVDAYQRARVDDRLMPLGVEVLYRAFTDVNDARGGRVTSQTSPVAHLLVESEPHWVLRDPADDAGEILAMVVGHDRSDEDAVTVSQPAGRRFPVVDTEGSQGARGRLTIYAPVAVRDKTIGLLRRGVRTLVQGPTGWTCWVTFPARDYRVEAGLARTITADYVEVG